MSNLITIANDRAIAVVDSQAGGRLTSLIIDGFEVLRDASFNLDHSIFGYGSFPMAPYAGRIRNGKFEFAGTEYQLTNLADYPHAMHGTVIYQKWEIESVSEAKCRISTKVDDGWPFSAVVSQTFELGPNYLQISMELIADLQMPAWIGFHPWFRKEIAGNKLELTANFTQMYVRDEEKVATKIMSTPKPLPWDDCFVGEKPDIRLTWGNLLTLELTSNYPYWVIYSAPEDALCVEPQSAPPNAIELEKAQILAAGEAVGLDFKLQF